MGTASKSRLLILLLFVVVGFYLVTRQFSGAAHVEIATNEDRVIAEVHDAQAKATREKLRSLQVRLDSARSLGANLRNQT